MSWWSSHVTHGKTFRTYFAWSLLIIAVVVLIVVTVLTWGAASTLFAALEAAFTSIANTITDLSLIATLSQAWTVMSCMMAGLFTTALYVSIGCLIVQGLLYAAVWLVNDYALMEADLAQILQADALRLKNGSSAGLPLVGSNRSAAADISDLSELLQLDDSSLDALDFATEDHQALLAAVDQHVIPAPSTGKVSLSAASVSSLAILLS